MLSSRAMEEPGGYEKTMSVLTDLSSMLTRGRLASRDARLHRAEIDLRKTDQDIRFFDSYFAGLPPEQHAAMLHGFADEVDTYFRERGWGEGGGNPLRHEAEYAGSLPSNSREYFELMPHMAILYRQFGREAFQEAALKPEQLKNLTIASDSQALGFFQTWWTEGARPFLAEYEPKKLKEIEEDGVDVAEIPAINPLLPEDLRLPEPMGTASLERLAREGLIPYVRSPKTKEHVAKKRGEAKRGEAPIERETAAFEEELRRETLAFEKELEAEEKSGDGASLADVDRLRSQFTGLSKTFVEVRDAFLRIQASIDDVSAAGDLSLVFNYMKMLDPDSVVRESEFATAENTAGVPDRIRKQWNKLQHGERLAPVQRADFAERAGKLMRQQLATQTLLEEQYSNIANEQSIKPELVTIDFQGGFRQERQEPEPPETEKDAEFVGHDDREGAVFRRKDGSYFRVTD
jgi:hypothetical protein